MVNNKKAVLCSVNMTANLISAFFTCFSNGSGLEVDKNVDIIDFEEIELLIDDFV